jgi:hypothetical protein
MKMSKRAASGLEGSIVKWTKIVEEMKLGNDIPNENGYDDCPLCQLYHPINIGKPMTQGCSSSCPIKKDTETDFCKGSPYMKWSKYCGGTLKNAQAMLDYLIGLRDRSKPTAEKDASKTPKTSIGEMS